MRRLREAVNIEAIVLLVGAAAFAGGIAFLIHDDLSGWGFLLVGVTFLTLLFFAVVASERRSCRIFSELNDLPSQFTVSTFCLVELEPGLWLDPELIRYSDGGLTIDTEDR